MATRPPIECPVCREPMNRGQKLDVHLFRKHRKRKLVKYIVSEVEAVEEVDISE